MVSILTLSDLSDPRLEEYEKLTLKNPDSLVYGSIKYLHFLEKITGARPVIFLAQDGEGRIVGTLPAFVKETEFGNVMNALPWYGSNPGIVTDPELTPANTSVVYNRLLHNFKRVAWEENCLSATVISRPFEDCEHYAPHFLEYTARMGMLNKLPPAERYGGQDDWVKAAIHADAYDRVKGQVHQKTRNQIRKGENSNISIESGPSTVVYVADLHRENMEAIGARPKPLSEFKALIGTFTWQKDYEAWIAYQDNELLAGLLVLYYNETVEYFVPGIKPEYRHLCPLHYLIAYAMGKAAARGFRFWNWGGTRMDGSQAGVYHFKERWNPIKAQYGYYTVRIDEEGLEKLTPAQIAQHFPGFFVRPF